MKLVSREEFIDLQMGVLNTQNRVELSTFHHKTSYYDKQGNLIGFYETFARSDGEMVSIYFIV